MRFLMLRRVVERELRIYRRLWMASAFSNFVGPLFFLAAMGLGLGNLVDQGSGEVDGLSYLLFVTPGVLVANAMQVAAGESLWPVLGGTKWLRYFHGMIATPLRPADVYGGYVVWLGIRAALGAIVFMLVATVLGGVSSWWGVLAVPAAALCAISFAAPLTAYSATRDNDATFGLIMRVGIVPLFLFSGTFFPVDQLPDLLQALVWLSPLWHGVELCRGATTGSIDPAAAVAHVAALLVFIAAGWVLGIRTFTQRLAS